MTRWMGLVAALLALLGTVAVAQTSGTYQQLTVDNTSGGVAISAATLSGMGACQARLETAQIRFRYDGTGPTTTVGTLLEIGDVVTFSNLVQARAARFIRTGSTSGVLNIACWPQP